MPGSVLTTLFICPGPMIALALCMIATRGDPEEFSVFFSSLILVTMLNQLDGLREVDRSRWFPDSVWLIVFINLAVYGSGVILFRTFVIVRIESLLNRRWTCWSAFGPVGYLQQFLWWRKHATRRLELLTGQRHFGTGS